MEQTRQTASVAEAAEMLGLSAASTYRAIERGEVPALRIGGRILVQRTRLLALIEGQRPENCERRDESP